MISMTSQRFHTSECVEQVRCIQFVLPKNPSPERGESWLMPGEVNRFVDKNDTAMYQLSNTFMYYFKQNNA